MASIDALMNREVVQATPDDSVAEVAARMTAASVGAVVVVGANGLEGIFSERDLLRRVVGAGQDPASTRVGSVATGDVVTVGPGTSLRDCAETLKKHGVRHLPIAEAGRVVGIISARDFFQAVTGELERYIERARYAEQVRENTDPYDHMGGSYGS